MKASELLARDKYLLSKASSDPFVVFKQQNLTKKSKVVKYSMEPVFNMLCEFTVPTAAAEGNDEDMDAVFEVRLPGNK